MNKMFTATSILQLAQAGNLGLENHRTAKCDVPTARSWATNPMTVMKYDPHDAIGLNRSERALRKAKGGR
jgi:hypothetical protein